MIGSIKKTLYFPLAHYFRFFAKIRLKYWNPRILVVTGSNGKTTLLHLLESQLGERAKYSFHANSSFGIPFDVLGFHRKNLLKTEWIGLILKTPFNAFKKPFSETIYIVEADCDRPGEGKFLAEFLKPEVVLWVSSAKTHSMNFDRLIKEKRFENVKEAIAFEFGYFLKYCSKLAIINGDSDLEKDQVKRTKAQVIQIKKEGTFEKYRAWQDGTEFEIKGKRYLFPSLLPLEAFYSIEMCKETMKYLNLEFNSSFPKFSMPAGRGSIFKGIKNTIIIDSCYNASPDSMKAVLGIFNKFEGKNKWGVIGDMLELGESEQIEHEKLAEILLELNLERIIFLGSRVTKYTYPRYQSKNKRKIPIDTFLNPREVLDFLKENIKGGETILFKGARFMEAIIENLLEDKNDVKNLSRRQKIWEKRRKQWGF